ncbi:hypothetical protein GN956_G7719 [Arapaima gigas]
MAPPGDRPADNTTVSLLPSCTYNEDFKQYLLPAVYSLVFVLGLPLNATVILRIWRSRRRLTRTTIYMLNLAVADFLYVCSLPLLIYNYGSHDYWPFGEQACKLVRFQFYSNLHGSILFLTCISFQRFLGICYPLATWHKFAATGTQRNRTVCYDLSEPQRATDYFPYGMALTCLGFALPFLAIVACYCSMARILCQGGGAALGTAGAQEKKDKAVRMIMVVVAVFVISFLPFHLSKTAYLLVRALRAPPCSVRNLYAVIYKSTRPFASMNSVLDPILFYFTQPRVRQSTMTLLQRITTTRDKSAHI